MCTHMRTARTLSSLLSVLTSFAVIPLSLHLLQCSLTHLAAFSPQLNFDLDRGVFPVVIQAVVDEGDGEKPFSSPAPF